MFLFIDSNIKDERKETFSTFYAIVRKLEMGLGGK